MRRKTSSRRRGIVLVWTALLCLIMALFFALSAETAYVYEVGHQLQNAADAGALAGALELEFSPAAAVTAATNTAQANKAAAVAIQLASNPTNDPAGDVVIGTYTRPSGPFTATLSSPNAVKVLVRRTASSPGGALPLIFGNLSNVKASNVSRSAIAMVGGTIGAGVVVLNPSGAGVVGLNGGGSVNVTGGAVVIDSNSSAAVSGNGNSAINASALYITGNDTAAAAYFTGGHLGLDSPPVPDPLASLTPPAKGATQSGNAPFNPGYYPNGLSSGTLAAGIYYVDGGISLKGNSTLDASAGVMIYLHSGGISMVGNSTFKINPPASGPYAGISIFQDRSNSSAISFKGTSGMNNTGTLYFPASTVSVQGNPTALGSQLIANQISAGGNGSFNLNYNGSFPVQGHEVFLVQ